MSVYCHGCGDTVPDEIAYRGGTTHPMHWNEQGGGHTTRRDAYPEIYTIIAVEELDALKWGAVIVDAVGDHWRHASFYPWEADAALYWTDARKPSGPMFSSDMVPLPVTLLYRPT